MSEEDWESEIDNAAVCVPSFSNLEQAFQDNQKSSSSNHDFNKNFGSFERGFENTKGNRSDRGDFGRGRGRGGYGTFNKDWDSNDNQESGGFSNNKNEENGSFGDGRRRGFQRRGGFDDDGKRNGFQRSGGFNDETSGFGKGRRGGRGGFGGGDRNENTSFTSHHGFGNADEKTSLTNRNDFNEETSGFGRGRRGGRGGSSFSGFGSEDINENTFASRDGFNNESSSFGIGRRGGRGGSSISGGFRGRNEDVGVKSGKGQDEFESSDQGPRVTYVPPPPSDNEADIFKHYETGINFDKYDDIVVDVSGSDAPPAILTFEEAKLPDTLARNVHKAGYEKLTPIQKHSIPIVMAGRDLMACAQTGSGKTAAFLLPILAHMMANGVASSSFHPLQEPEAIVVAPTRELIYQIYLDARKFAYGTCVRPVVIYGGTQTGYSLRQISQGCNVLCATPGRLLDVIKKEKIGLSKVRYLVLDEADRMLDMGFKEDIYALLHSPGMTSTENRQTLMFSATFPTQIQSLAREILKPDYLFVVVGQVGGACSDVEQQVVEVEEYGKKDKLMEILQEIGNERTMVFVKTKKKADFIATFLCQEKIPSTSIHGDRLQKEREIALKDFRTGQCPVIVATSVAARGLDIENVSHVINFDIPDDIDEYVHRIGRTGRCGNTGRAISFFDRRGDDEQRIARSLVKVLADAHQEVPAWLEEIAFSAQGMPGFNPRAHRFASTDDRKRGGFSEDQRISGYSPSVAQMEENWE
ncbi:probable ATP-dependent RNA helicase DDX4 isoform X2 [Pyxicephalus adspersus]|uniref:Probable ATP-dependent RNA helicase DDX4 n=1 Tax=Pyxicephalus adspersus TaxID=30357 RepID=A0AAV3AAH7_PYXAD|nr:TPA: hypothetical protein GDO54_014474 [Pyxicephalus adspersus]